jgi:hypothetical protein
VLPLKPLEAAGAGANQDIDLSDEIKAVMYACPDAEQFGMYSPVAPVPTNRRRESVEGIEIERNAEVGIYVHSKILIVDDKWMLVGSANAGGISLEGVTNLGFGRDRGATPDSELSAIIYDEKLVKEFRGRLWGEHLDGAPGGSGALPAALDAFRKQAVEGKRRLRFAKFYMDARSDPSDVATRIRPAIVDGVRKGARIVADPESSIVLLKATPPTIFTATYELPPNYQAVLRWSLRDPGNQAYFLRSLPSNGIAQDYGSEQMAYIPSRTAALLRERGISRARLLCRVMLMPVGVSPRRTWKEQDTNSVLLELPIELF